MSVATVLLPGGPSFWAVGVCVHVCACFRVGLSTLKVAVGVLGEIFGGLTVSVGPIVECTADDANVCEGYNDNYNLISSHHRIKINTGHLKPMPRFTNNTL